ncbi:MAG: endonuclease [Gelidibacter sp.]
MELQSTHTIAFYNIENLFDVNDDPLTNDNDFLPSSAKHWDKKRYERKLYKSGLVISKIGFDALQKPPTIIGLAEIENDAVLENLIQTSELKPYNYGFVHYDSSDERGIDVALLYNKDDFTLEHSETFEVLIKDDFDVRDYTRDILLVSGVLEGEKLHFIVNHWPSRHEGSDVTAFKRKIAANKVIEIITKIRLENTDAKIIVMGDFNDNPNDESVKHLKNMASLYNPMETLWSNDRGSVNFNFKWIQFDQILFTTNFFEPNPKEFAFHKADIFDDAFLTQYKGKYKGQPFRTYVGKKYKGGFSDHFPVYIQLKK